MWPIVQRLVFLGDLNHQNANMIPINHIPYNNLSNKRNMERNIVHEHIGNTVH